MQQVDSEANDATQDVQGGSYYFTVDVEKPHGKPFGLSTSSNNEGVEIHHVKPNTIASQWNAKATEAGFPQDRLQYQDIILCVNGVRGTSSVLGEEMAKATDLLLVIKRQLMDS